MSIDWPQNALPQGRTATTRLVAMPADTNPAGDIFGGWIMSQVDLAGGVEAVGATGGRVATVAVNSFQFHQPVRVGDLISCYTHLEKVGNTSVTVNVVVYAQRNRQSREIVQVTRATLVYVALDEHGNPRVIEKNK